MKYKLKLRIIGVFYISIILISVLTFYIVAQTEDKYWPTDEWLVSTPEEQGMESQQIARMYDYIEDHRINVQSLLILRNGYIIDEHYLQYYKIIESQTYGNYSDLFNQIRDGRLHALWSCTKSILSVLVGIAIDKGFISNLNQTFFSIFPDKWKSIYNNETKMNITIEHLLTMTSGFQWEEGVDFFTHWSDANYSLDYILKKNLVANPGKIFNYSSGDSQLISAILQNKTGLKTSEFARQYLFNPIGVEDDDWDWDEVTWEWGEGLLENITFGGFGLYMTPRAMARFGLLCLNNGNWNGTQIVSEEWVNLITTIHVHNPKYGYLFWLNPHYYYAAGFLGQRIFVIPDKQIIVVFTGADVDYYLDSDFKFLIDNFILKEVPILLNPQIPILNLLFFLGIITTTVAVICKKQLIFYKFY